MNWNLREKHTGDGFCGLIRVQAKVFLLAEIHSARSSTCISFDSKEPRTCSSKPVGDHPHPPKCHFTFVLRGLHIVANSFDRGRFRHVATCHGEKECWRSWLHSIMMLRSPCASFKGIEIGVKFHEIANVMARVFAQPGKAQKHSYRSNRVRVHKW